MYYKVVSKDLRSCVITGKYNVEYKVGEFVYPEKMGSYLFIFDTIEAALSFATTQCEGGHLLYVYRCEAEGIEIKPDNPQMSGCAPPTGTVFAYGVKLLELCKTVTPINQNPVVKYGDIVYIHYGPAYIITPLGLIRKATYDSYYDRINWRGRTLEDLRTTYPDLEWGLNDE